MTTTLDTPRTLTPTEQQRLDALADALTETVMQRLMANPTFVDRLVEAMHHRGRARALKQREAILATLRAFEEAHDLPRAIPAKRDAA